MSVGESHVLLRGEDAGATGLLDLLLGRGLEKAVLGHVQNRGLASGRRALFLRKQRNQLVEVDDGAVELVPLQVVRPHTDFAEITGMVFVEIDPVVMLSTGVTATTGMLAVFADTTMAVAHVSAQLSGLLGLLLGHFESLL